MEIKDQVRFKKNLRNGIQILYGTIVSFKDSEKKVALVSIQSDPKKPRTLMASARVEIPVTNLEPVKNLFGGRTIVQANPTFRNLSSLCSQLNNR